MKADEFQVLLEELKAILKKRKMTYRDLGLAAGITEAGVKRIFTSRDGKVSTLSRVCEALGFTFIDLVASSKLSTRAVSYLNEKQDQAFANDFALYVFFNELVIRKKPVEQIAIQHGLEKIEVEKFLLRLERLDIIQRSKPGKPAAMLKSPIGIKKSGKLRDILVKEFSVSLTKHLLNSKTDSLDSYLRTREWMMSSTNEKKLKSSLEQLLLEYDQLSARDEAVLSERDLVPVSFITGALLTQSPYRKISSYKSKNLKQ